MAEEPPVTAAGTHVQTVAIGGENSGITVTWERHADHRLWGFHGPWRCEQRELGEEGTCPDQIRNSKTLPSAIQAAQWLRILLCIYQVTLPAHQAKALVEWVNDPSVQTLHQHLEAHALSVTVAVAHTTGALAWRIGPIPAGTHPDEKKVS
ncbi:hypothetical protein [Streptomyces lydicus]|uniref:hypothetical protein n=1 Tax=Streptomyces lydicus TaxID=47763 RepID=UPI0036E4014A